MMVRQTTTTIPSLQLILLLLSRHVASVSLSQFQQIQGFSTSCENVWLEDIPGCSTQDFTKPNSCSRNCIAGVNIINAEVLVACVDARVSRNTLLGEFLAGFGVAALCGSSGSSGSGGTSESTTIADSTTATTTAVKTTATSTSLTSVQSTTTTAVQDTTTQPSVLSTTSSATTSTTSSITTSTTSTSITSTSITELTLSFSGTTTTSPTSSVSTTTSAKTSSTSSSNTEGKGFGGVGDAFDILGGESAGSRLEYMSFEVMSLMSVLIIAVARAIW